MELQVESAIQSDPDVRLPIVEEKLASASCHEESPKTHSLRLKIRSLLHKIPSLLLDSSDTLSAFRFLWILGITITIVALSVQNPGDILRSRQQFKSWYSQYSYQFNIIARDECKKEYSTYLYGTYQNTTTPTLTGAGGFTMYIQPMINCLLKNSSEYIKYQLATSQVVLGITPTIICLLGATTEELCLCALIGRRRLLGLLLSAASPSIYTERAFKYQDPDQILRDLKDNHVKSTVITKPRWAFVVLEYVVVLAAVANIATLNWQLGLKSINTLSANTIYMPMIWSIMGILAHLMGAVVFDMRARKLNEVTMEPEERPTIRSSVTLKAITHPPKLSSISKSLADMVYTELFWPPPDKSKDSTTEQSRSGLDRKPRKRIDFTLLEDSRCFTLLAWVFSIVVIFHIIIGTLVLSSTNFVGPKDALAIMARYIASVVVCRIILVYELAVLKMNYIPPAGSDE